LQFIRQELVFVEFGLIGNEQSDDAASNFDEEVDSVIPWDYGRAT